jgi:hypothetical protein
MDTANHRGRGAGLVALAALGSFVLSVVLWFTDSRQRSAGAGRRRLGVPLLTPWLSSLWIGFVTPVDAGVARPLIESLRSATLVTDRSGAALFPVTPAPFGEALRRALAEQRTGGPGSAGGGRHCRASEDQAFREGAGRERPV